MHCKSIIFFRLLMLVLHQIIFYDLEKSFTMNIKITMTNDDKDWDEKLQYNINKELTKISALL